MVLIDVFATTPDGKNVVSSKVERDKPTMWLTKSNRWKLSLETKNREDVFTSQREAISHLKLVEKNIRLQKKFEDGPFGMTYTFVIDEKKKRV